MIEINPKQLLEIIGKQTVQIELLNAKVVELSQIIEKLTPKPEEKKEDAT